MDLGDGVRVRNAATGELAAHWPEAQGLLPPDFGREPDRLCVLELERSLRKGEPEPPDAPGELADAVTALRLATAGPVAAGPVLFERLDWRPYGIRPVLPIASTQPDGEPTRLDEFRGRLAGDLRGRLLAADEDLELGEALDRWELSLFQPDPFRAEQLRESLTFLLGGGDGALGGGRARRGAARRDAAPSAARSWRGCKEHAPSPDACAARSSKSCCTATGRSCWRRRRRRCSGSAPAGGLFHTSGNKLTHVSPTVDRVEEACAVIHRLDRIDALEREGAHPTTLLAELRELVREAEAWARLEGDERAQQAVDRCEEAMASDIVNV